MKHESVKSKATEPPPTQQPPLDQLDWFLQTLVGMVNRNLGVEVGVTLQVSGLLVSGLLTSGASYFEGIANDIAAGFQETQDSDAIKQAFVGYADLYKRPSPTTAYLHLKEARFFDPAGTPIPTHRGVWWRGRLSEVSGFVLGTLSRD